MELAMRRLLAITPFLFGIGFIAPLIGQIMPRFGLAAPWGWAPLSLGLVIGAAWGALANWRGRWF